eukprot:1341154-Amorphochlora_amoeboformis.AAC.2
MQNSAPTSGTLTLTLGQTHWSCNMLQTRVCEREHVPIEIYDSPARCPQSVVRESMLTVRETMLQSLRACVLAVKKCT